MTGTSFKVCLQLAQTSFFSFFGIVTESGVDKGHRVTYGDLYPEGAFPEKGKSHTETWQKAGHMKYVFR